MLWRSLDTVIMLLYNACPQNVSREIDPVTSNLSDTPPNVHPIPSDAL